MDDHPAPLSEPTPAEAESAAFLVDEALGYLHSAVLRTAAVIGVADHLAAGPRTAAELASATGTRPGPLYRILRLLATRGVVHEDAHGRFHLTATGSALRTGSPASVRDAVIGVTDTAVWHAAGRIDDTVHDGQGAFERVWGMSFFDYYARNEEAAATLHRGMSSMTDASSRALLEFYDFPPAGTIVDVGGGHGRLLVETLRRHPGLRGVLFDQPHVVGGHELHGLGADDRWEVVGGDFFDAVPGGDVHVLKHVLHDWPDGDCARILRRCRDSLAPGGRIVIVDAVIPPGNDPHRGKLLDISMMLLFGGRERTEAEFTRVCADAGLRLARVVHTGTPVSILEAIPE